MKTKNVSFSGFGRILAWLFALITLLFGLAACGGGGGSTTPVVTHPPAPTPVVGNLSILVSPTNGATGVVPTSNIVLNYASSTNSYASSNATLTCDGTSIALAQSTDQAAKKVTFAPASVFPYGKTCIAQGSSTASGLDGGASTTVNWSATFTIEQLICSKPGEQVSADGQTCAPVATAWWPPKNITPMGVKDLSSGLNQLPDGCLSFTAECFKSFVSAGKMTAVNTTAVMTGMPAPDNRTLVTLAYKTPSGKMQLTLFFADNGQAAVQDVVDFNTSDPFDWVMGNERGYIIKRSADGTCAQWKWNYNSTTGKGLFWDYEVTACPQ